MAFLVRRRVSVAAAASGLIIILALQCKGDNSEAFPSAKAETDRQLVLQQVRPLVDKRPAVVQPRAGESDSGLQ